MNLLTTLCAGGSVVTDGAWGTQLQARGLQPGDCPDAWNLAWPDDGETVGDLAFTHASYMSGPSLALWPTASAPATTRGWFRNTIGFARPGGGR